MCLALGALLLLGCGTVTAILGLALVFWIIAGNASHRPLAAGPAVDGFCRFFLYVLSASVGERGVTGWAIWCGLALAFYRMGAGYLGRWRLTPAKARPWPILLLVVPIGLALIMDVEQYRETGLLLSAVLGLWLLRCLRQTFWSIAPDVNRTVQSLVAGMVFVDWLATCPGNLGGPAGTAARQLSFLFLLLFGLTLLLQKLTPEK
jgi:4-hydroxybenzoate polyprenyltransferase